MKKKNIIALILVCILMTGLISCGKTDNSQTSKPAAGEKAEEAKEEAKEEAQETSDEKEEASDEKAKTSDEKAEETAGKETGKPAVPAEVLICLPEDRVMGTSFEIWNSLIEPLRAEGIELQTQMYSDQQMLKAFMEMNLPTLVVSYEEPEDASIIAYTLCIPYNLYSEKYSTTKEMADAKAYVGLPGDFRYSMRLQAFLEAAGLLTLKNGPSPELEQGDYEAHFETYAFDGNVQNDDWMDYFDAVVGFGYTEAHEPIFTDPNNDNEEYWQRLYCRTEDTQDPEKLDAYEKIVKAFQSENVREILKETIFTPAGWDQDLISRYR